MSCALKFHGVFFQIRESEEDWGVPHSFTLFGQRQSVVVAARYQPMRRRDKGSVMRIKGGISITDHPLGAEETDTSKNNISNEVGLINWTVTYFPFSSSFVLMQ